MILDPLLDYFRGKAITVPPMDGALRPNTALEVAEIALAAPAPDNLVISGKQVLYSSGNEILALPISKRTKPKRVAQFDEAVSALACSPDGALAVGLDGGGVIIRGGEFDGKLLSVACPVALAFLDAATLLVCQGSATRRPSAWTADLMDKGSSGILWRIDLAGGGATRLARELAFPFGLLADPARGRVIVSESWRHRLIAIPLDSGAPQPVLTRLPGYPARLCPTRDGGALLCLFAPRNRLIEFVLGEVAYRADMMREIDQEHWIAPALSSGASFLEPLQCGGVKTMGIHKPWSPSRSYGLVVKLDSSLQPVASFHSRANGTRHGITSVLETGGAILAAAKGGNVILRIREASP